jgi:hypothetical protein
VSETGTRTWLGVRRGLPIHRVSGFRGEQSTIFPQSAIDLTNGPRRGRLYLAYSDFDAQLDRYVIRVAHSDDLGKTWATVLVSDTTMRGVPSNVTAAVNKDGTVALVWYDRRDDPKHACWQLYASASVDGGDTFSANTRLSEKPSCPGALPNWILSSRGEMDTWTYPGSSHPYASITSMVPVRFPNSGDTQGLGVDRNGQFHVAWSNGETGVLQLWHSSFDVIPRSQSQETSLASARAPSATKVDLSASLRIETSKPRINLLKGELEVTLRIVNPTPDHVVGPIDLVVDTLLPLGGGTLGLEQLRVANSDNGLPAHGASWIYMSDIPPRGRSGPRILRFSFKPGIPREPVGAFSPTFSIYGSRFGKAHPRHEKF